MNLTYTANALCAVEEKLGKSLVSILAELELEEGASLTTLRALVAAGRHGAMYAAMPATFLDEHTAGRLIDEHGAASCSGAVGKALKTYFERGAE